MFARNQCFEMTCESFGQDAQGVCRHEGIAVFVPGLLPGERALVRIVKPEKRYAFGRMEKLLEKALTAPSRSARSINAAAAASAST
ncbi:MAG: TRAM domain-containing protein [Christensenellales bacterium]